MTRLTHKEMAAHIRKRLKAGNIPARVRMLEYCGVRAIAVIGKTYDTFFTAEQCKEIAIICKTNGLTKAQNSPINIEIEEQLTGSNEKHFEFHG